MARKLSPLEVHQVKLLICEGFSQTDVARALDISQGSVSKICLGDTHRDIPWPNPDVGEKLLRKRGKRSKQDQAQARLASGIAQAPRPQLPEPSQVIRMSENEAVEQARQQADTKEKRIKLFREMNEQVEEEMNAEFLKDMTTVKKGGKGTELKKMPTAWDVSFLSWEEVVERAEGNTIIEALKDEGDDTVQRAVGIVFYSLDEDKWDTEQTVQMVASVVKQLNLSQKDAK